MYLPFYNAPIPRNAKNSVGSWPLLHGKGAIVKADFLLEHPPWFVKPCLSYQVLVHHCGNRHTSTPWQLHEACNTSDFPGIHNTRYVCGWWANWAASEKKNWQKRQNGNIQSVLQPRCLYFVCDAHVFAVLEMKTFKLWGQKHDRRENPWFCVTCHQLISLESWKDYKILQVQVLCPVFIEYSRKCVIPNAHDKWAWTAGLHGWSNEMHPLNCIEDSVHTALHRTYKVRHQSRVVSLALSWPT